MTGQRKGNIFCIRKCYKDDSVLYESKEVRISGVVNRSGLEIVNS